MIIINRFGTTNNAVAKGDSPGHPFRGNQYGAGEGGGGGEGLNEFGGGPMPPKPKMVLDEKTGRYKEERVKQLAKAPAPKRGEQYDDGQGGKMEIGNKNDVYTPRGDSPKYPVSRKGWKMGTIQKLSTGEYEAVNNGKSLGAFKSPAAAIKGLAIAGQTDYYSSPGSDPGS
jgi:hypothetical protein